MTNPVDHCLPIPETPSLLRSLGEVASHINASTDLDTTLRHLLEAVCRETPWAASGIMSVDPDEGYAEVIARHDPGHIGAILSDRWLLAESPSRLALATARCLTTNAPGTTGNIFVARKTDSRSSPRARPRIRSLRPEL